jgi:hypothetical protein
LGCVNNVKLVGEMELDGICLKLLSLKMVLLPVLIRGSGGVDFKSLFVWLEFTEHIWTYNFTTSSWKQSRPDHHSSIGVFFLFQSRVKSSRVNWYLGTCTWGLIWAAEWTGQVHWGRSQQVSIDIKHPGTCEKCSLTNEYKIILLG